MNGKKFQKLFNEILYDDLPNCVDKYDLAEILIKLHKVEDIIIVGGLH